MRPRHITATVNAIATLVAAREGFIAVFGGMAYEMAIKSRHFAWSKARMRIKFDRRETLKGIGAGMLCLPLLSSRIASTYAANITTAGPQAPFTHDLLKSAAAGLAGKPWQAPVAANAPVLHDIDYDSYQQIRFRKDAAIPLDAKGQYAAEFFHPGRLFKEPVQINTFQTGRDTATPVSYSPRYFETPENHPARNLGADTGFAGFRIMNPNRKSDWLAFLGASYFRSSGPFDQYGLSARGLAIDTGLERAEEFPRFSAFWMGTNQGADAPILIYALLDSPSVTGAYRFSVKRSTDERDIHRVAMQIDCDLYARKDIERLGIAPFSSMFWYGEANRKHAADWRPEIHDSDGLAILTGSNERIWRPILNPPRVMTNTFADRDPKGFGLLQRDRDFVHYLDDGVFYERRPSVWVEPFGQWGEGAVHLVEIPTDDETNDNIVAYWCPKEKMRSGEHRHYAYRLTWLDDIAFPESLGRATATWTGIGGRPGQKRPAGVRKFVIDFQGPVFAGLGRGDGVEISVTASRGALNNMYAHPVVDQRERWRAFFDLDADGREPVDLRAYLKRGDRALTETWLYQYFPEA